MKEKAFPVFVDAPTEDAYVQNGMDLRDWFAGLAMSRLISKKEPCPPDMVAVDAYLYADAMMKQRNPYNLEEENE